MRKQPSHRNSLTPRRLAEAAGRLASLAAMALLPLPALGQPAGGQLVHGTGSIRQNANSTVIHAGNGAIFNFHSFNINQGHTVQFIQPGSTSRVLNRITGPDPSVIAGNLTANGIVYIANPAGVYFRSGALVNVGGIYAAAGKISNHDFLSGTNRFTNLAGVVENRGTINGGEVGLIGARVANYGVINAPNGMVTMAAGGEVYVGEQNGNFFAKVSGQPAAPAGGTGVKQAGEVNARGGRVLVSAGDMYAMAIDHPGRTRAKEITVEGGKGGVVGVSGTLDASNTEAGGVGGTVKVLGEKVGIFDGRIDASGDAGGGTILVGGNWQGKGPERNAEATYLSKDSSLKADALTHGDGGTIVAWADGITRAYGDISARGGSQGGRGGLVETSGKNELEILRTPDVTAARGQGGLWLIDPRNVDIVPGGGNTNIPAVPTAGVFAPTGNNAQLGVNLILAALTGNASVTVNTGSDGMQAGIITLTAGTTLDFNGTGTNTLTLDAANNIILDGIITDSVAGGDALNLVLNAGGLIEANAALTLGSGNLTFNSTGSTFLNTATINAANITFTGATVLEVDTTLNSGGLVHFQGTLNGTTAATELLNIASGNGRFDGAVGGSTRLETLTVAGTTLIGADITTDGLQTYTGAVTLGGNSVLASTANAAIGFGGAIDGGFGLTINTTGATTIGGAVGGTSALVNLITNAGGTTTLTGNVTTSGVQTYGDNVTLAANVTAASTGNSAITFGGTVDGGFDLAVNTTGATGFGGAVGGSVALTSLTTNTGGATTLTGNVTTTGAQTYNDSVTLAANTVAASTGNAAIGFGGTVNGGFSLDVNTTGATSFGGAIGGSSALTTLTTNTGGTTSIGGNVTTSAAQTYNDNVTLAGNATLASTGNAAIGFAGTVNGAFGLTVNTTGATSFGGVVGGSTALTTLTTNAGGTTSLNGNVTTTGGQIFNDNVTLLTNHTSTSTGNAAVFFGGTVNGAFSLVANTGGATTFGGAVGGTVALTSLTTNAGGTTNLGGDITTTGAQSFGDTAILTGNAVLSSTGNQAISFAGPVNGGFALTVNTTGATTFSGAVGNTTALTSLSTNAGGTTSLGGNVTTSGNQTYGDNVTLTGNTTAASTGNSAIGFGGTVDGAFSLTVNTTGATSFGGAIGGSTALTSVSTDSGGTTSLGGNVTTTGAQDFADAVTLNTNITAASTGNSSVNFGTVDGAFALVVNTSGATSFEGAVGGSVALASLTTNAGGSTSLGGSVTTSGAQAYNDAVLLTGNATLTSTGNQAIDFASSVNGAFGLSVVTGGATTFSGTVGNLFSLSSLATSGGGNTTLAGTVSAGSVNIADTLSLNGGSVFTTGNQLYSGAVTLGANTTASSSGGGSINFASTVDGAFSLAANTTGATSFGGVVGGSQALTSLSTNTGGTTSLAGDVTTTGAINLGDNVTLAASVVAASTGNQAITFGGTVNGGFSLDVNTTGATTFAGAVGGTQALTTLTTNAGGTASLRSVTTSGAQAYNDSSVTLDGTYTGSSFTIPNGTTVALAGATVVNATGGGAISFGDTIDGAFSLAANTSGVTTFSGNIGGSTPLASLSTDAGGSTVLDGTVNAGSVNFGDALAFNSGSVTTTGDQTYGGAVVLAVDTTLNSGGLVRFQSTLNGTGAGTEFLDIATGNGRFDGIVGGAQRLETLTVAGTTQIGANITTEGAQTYTGAATMGGNATLASAANDTISFGGTINGAFGLTVNTTGATNFGGAIGNTTALASLTTNAGGTTTLGGNVTTSGAQTYNDALTLGTNTTAASNSGGAISFNSTVTGAFGLTVNTSGATTFATALTGLTSLTTDAGGTTTLNGNVTTTGAQNFGDNVILGANIVAASTGNQAIAFGGTVNGAFSLDVNTSGATTFGGAVGNTTALTTLTTNAGGSSSLQSVTTTGAQTYNDASVTLNGTYTGSVFTVAGGSAAVLGGNTTVSTGAGAINFGGTVNGAFALTANSTGATTISGVVGGSQGLASLTTNAGGTTTLSGAVTAGTVNIGDTLALSGGAVTSTGNQTYAGAVTLGADTTINSGGLVQFQSTLNGIGAGTEFLNIASGNGRFDAAVGGSQRLESLTVAGTSAIGANITTQGLQTYTGASTLLANTTLASQGNAAIGFGSTLNGAFALTVNTAGATSFGGAVGNTQALTSLTTNAGGTTSLAANVTTTGAQSYGDNVALAGNSTAASTGNQAISFGGTVNGPFNLVVNTTGATTFSGPLGNTTALASLTTNAGGSTTLSGNVTTSGAQSYNDDLTLAAAVTALSTGAGNISFGSSINGAFALAVNTTGATTFSGPVGNTTALSSLSTNAGGSTTLGGPITTVGAQSYGDSVTLAAATTTASTGGGNIAFGGTLDGPFALAVNTAGVSSFAGAIGSSQALASLSTSAAGSTTIGGTVAAGTISIGDTLALNGGAVTTTGGQTYLGAVTLGADTVINSGGLVRFQNTLNGAGAGTELLNIASGNARFDAAVGGGQRLELLTVAGTTLLGADITTQGLQTYSGAATLAGNVVASSLGGGAIGFGGAVNGAFGLTVNTSGATSFAAPIGGTTALASITTDAGGTTALNGDVTTTGAQSFGDSVTLGTDTIALSTGNGAIAFGAVDGGFGLTVNTGGATTLGSVGGATALTSLTTDAGGSTTLDGATVRAADVMFSDAVIVGADVTLTASNQVLFQTTLDSQGAEANDLVINSPLTLFSGAVGATAGGELGRLATDAAGSTRIGGGSIAAAEVDFADAVELTASAVISGSTSVNFGSTVLSQAFASNDLTVNSPSTTFGSTIGDNAGGILGVLTTDAAGATTIVGAVNAGAVALGDAVTFNGATITTSGNQDYTGSLNLGADTTLLGQEIRLAVVDSVGANRSLTVTAGAGGLARFGGSAGGNLALREVVVNGGGHTEVAGDITTDGGAITFGNNVRVDGTADLYGDTGITFNAALDGMGASSNLTLRVDNTVVASVQAPAIPMVLFTTDVGQTTALTSLTFGSTTLGVVPQVATIGADLASFTINTTGGFEMRQNQKLSVTGDLTINAGGTAILGDVSVGGLFTVNAAAIGINRRAAGSILGLAGAALTPDTDSGVDIVAGQGITFSVAPVALGGDFLNPTFATPGAAGISDSISGFVQQNFAGDPATLILSNGVFLDLRSEGPSNTNVAQAIAGAAPRESQSGQVSQDTGVGRAARELLVQIGVYAREANFDSLLEFLSGRAIYNDLPAKVQPGADDYQVTENRLSPEIVTRVLDDYRLVFVSSTIDEQTGQPALNPVGETLAAAWAEYSSADRGGLTFRAYLEATPDQAQALAYLNGLQKLFSDLEYLGLTSKEASLARQTVLKQVKIPGLTPAQIEGLIWNQGQQAVSEPAAAAQAAAW